MVSKINMNFPWDLDIRHMTLHYRVNKSELSALAEELLIPDQFCCPNGTVASGVEGLSILWQRFAYPCQFGDIMHQLGRSVPVLSLIV